MTREDIFVTKVKSNYPRGSVIDSDEKSFKCGACGQSSMVKNNAAIVEEYRRLRRRFRRSEPQDACPERDCENHGKAQGSFPDLYRKSGWTAKGAQRWKCEACLTSFSVGSRIRRQHRSSAYREVLWMLTNAFRSPRLPISASSARAMSIARWTSSKIALSISPRGERVYSRRSIRCPSVVALRQTRRPSPSTVRTRRFGLK